MEIFYLVLELAFCIFIARGVVLDVDERAILLLCFMYLGMIIKGCFSRLMDKLG